MREIGTLSDSVLARLAWAKRRDALHGDRKAYDLARTVESGIRRRGTVYSQPMPLEVAKKEVETRKRPWWRFCP